MATTLVAGERFYYNGRTLAKGESFECQDQDVALLTWYQTPKAAAAGGAPAWVPANAKIHVDFLGGSPQGRAWSNGAAVDPGTLIGNDPAANSAAGDTGRAYQTSDLNANGLRVAFSGFLGDAKTRLINGATLVYQFYEVTTARLFSVMWNNSDGGVGFQIDANPTGAKQVNAYSLVGGFGINTGADLVFVVGGCVNKIATTLVADRWDVACNGGAVASGALTAAHRPPANPMVCAYWNSSLSTTRLQSITIYDPLPTTAGLSALSAVT